MYGLIHYKRARQAHLTARAFPLTWWTAASEENNPVDDPILVSAVGLVGLWVGLCPPVWVRRRRRRALRPQRS